MLLLQSGFNLILWEWRWNLLLDTINPELKEWVGVEDVKKIAIFANIYDVSEQKCFLITHIMYARSDWCVCVCMLLQVCIRP